MSVDWQANWIWNTKLPSKNSFVEFRRNVTLPVSSTSVYVHISACQEYLLYLDGNLIGRGPSPSDPKWQYYDSYEISQYCRNETHVIAVVCYHFGEKEIATDQMQGDGGLILQLEVNGIIYSTTDEQWKCRKSPRWSERTERISHWGGFKEIYIASKEDDWETLNYEDKEWENALVIAKAYEDDSPWPRLLPREIPFMHKEIVFPRSLIRTELNFGGIHGAENLLEDSVQQDVLALDGMTIEAGKPGAFPSIVYDYEREVVGRPIVEVDVPLGGVLRIAYGESLELQFVDTFILKPGHNLLQPFGRRACRFLQLTFAAACKPIIVNSLKFELTHYPFPDLGKFISNDKLTNQIWEISKYTTLMNSHDHLEDCPWREKALWVVDAVVMGKVIYSIFGETQLMRKCLLQGARIQNDDGSIPGTGPERNKHVLPDFCAYWILGVYDYWNYSGDHELVQELWPTLKRVLDWFEAQTDESGLFARADRPDWWCFIDWTDEIDKRDKVTAISCLYYKVLLVMEKLAFSIGESQTAIRYLECAEQLYAAIRKHLWLKESQLFADCMAGTELSQNITLQTNFLAIWCGIMTRDESEYFITEYYDKKQLPEIKGAFFQHIVLESLISLDRDKQAWNLIQYYWGEMVRRGATTWWETFDPSSPACSIPSTYQGNTPTYLWEAPPVSHCHAWGSSPAYILHWLVLGVDVSQLGNKTVILKRPLAEAKNAQGRIPTRFGCIEIEWSFLDDHITGTIIIPDCIRLLQSLDYTLRIVRKASI